MDYAAGIVHLVFSDEAPKYRQIMDVLVERIRTGVYTPEKAFPGERELARQFDVARNTISKVLDELEQLGFVTRKSGTGTRVRERWSSALYQGLEELSRYLGEYDIQNEYAIDLDEGPHVLIPITPNEDLMVSAGGSWLMAADWFYSQMPDGDQDKPIAATNDAELMAIIVKTAFEQRERELAALQKIERED